MARRSLFQLGRTYNTFCAYGENSGAAVFTKIQSGLERATKNGTLICYQTKPEYRYVCHFNKGTHALQISKTGTGISHQTEDHSQSKSRRVDADRYCRFFSVPQKYGGQSHHYPAISKKAPHARGLSF